MASAFNFCQDGGDFFQYPKVDFFEDQRMLIFRGYEDRYYQSIYEWNGIHLGISGDRFMRLHNTLMINDDNRIALHAREKINVVIRIQNGCSYWVDMLWKTRSGDPFTFPIEASENL